MYAILLCEHFDGVLTCFSFHVFTSLMKLTVMVYDIMPYIWGNHVDKSDFKLSCSFNNMVWSYVFHWRLAPQQANEQLLLFIVEGNFNYKQWWQNCRSTNLLIWELPCLIFNLLTSFNNTFTNYWRSTSHRFTSFGSHDNLNSVFLFIFIWDSPEFIHKNDIFYGNS